METTFFRNLRLANLKRCKLFKNAKGELAHPNGVEDWTVDQWYKATSGELGEFANLHKKVDRGDFTLEEAKECLAEELADPPSGSQGLHWLLYTTEPVGNIQEVSRIVDIYKMRWKIEELFLILKSGCRIEEVQFSTASRLAKVVALYAPVAVRILQLRDSAASVPEQACTAILSEQEWRALWTYIHKTRPSKEQAPPSILQAVMWIGRMGGHLGRKSDARPGVRTLWKGLRDLSLLTEMYSQASL